jgi:hypothetical protein
MIQKTQYMPNNIVPIGNIVFYEYYGNNYFKLVAFLLFTLQMPRLHLSLIFFTYLMLFQIFTK